MEYIINKDICEKYNLTPDECLVLITLIKEENPSKIIESLIQKGFVSRSVLDENIYITSDSVKDLVTAVLIESKPKALMQEQEITELAKEMQEIFPKGRKAGTTYYWRCSLLEVTRKLKTLIGKYHATLERDKVIAATRDYVQSFNGDYTKMRLLKYFILKAGKDSDGNTVIYSDLMSRLENESQENLTSSDWTDRVI